MMTYRTLGTGMTRLLLATALGWATTAQVLAASPRPDRLAQNSTQSNQLPNGQPNQCRGGAGQSGQLGRPPRPDFAAAAQKLGVSRANLMQALGLPEKPPTDENGRPSGPPPRPDLKAAAQRLGVTEEQLVQALGRPPRPQNGDRPEPMPNQ